MARNKNSNKPQQTLFSFFKVTKEKRDQPKIDDSCTSKPNNSATKKQKTAILQKDDTVSEINWKSQKKTISRATVQTSLEEDHNEKGYCNVS